ncbi:MAG: hypothetical protein J3Q66DRAFT_180211 [Benniella sp.]|nr:MAG: hypothetical protein J3Q66DRAFT_180211 [Benniella sp.]
MSKLFRPELTGIKIDRQDLSSLLNMINTMANRTASSDTSTSGKGDSSTVANLTRSAMLSQLSPTQKHHRNKKHGSDKDRARERDSSARGITVTTHKLSYKETCAAQLRGYIRDLLRLNYDDLSIPRLFIVLPNQQDKKLLQLFFLCECGNHTKGANGQICDIHFVNHTGYDLERQDEFIADYGSYILVTLYMLRDGAVAQGCTVPPLRSLDITGTRDIHSLVHESIHYLEKKIYDRKSGIKYKECWKLEASKLEQVKTYLRNLENSSGLFDHFDRVVAQDSRCVWICHEHRREYHEAMVHRLKEVITGNGGVFLEENGAIVIRLGTGARQETFHNALRKVCWIQDGGNGKALATIDLQLTHTHAGVTYHHILVNLNAFVSLRMDFA